MLTSEAWPAILPRGFGWGTLALVSQGLGQWVAAAAIARVLGPAALGDFAFAWAVATPVLMALSFQLRALQITEAVPDASLADFLTLRILSVSVAVALVVMAGLIMRTSPVRLETLGLIALSRSFEFTSEVVHAHWIRRGDVSRYGKSMTTRNLLGATGAALALGCGLGLLGVCAVLCVCSGLSLVADLLAGDAGPWPAWRRSILDTILRKGLPLTAAMLLLSVQPLIPRYLIQWHLGAAALGVFAALAYLPMSAAILVRAYGDTASTRMARAYSEARHREAGEQLRSSILAVVSVATIASFFLWRLGEPLLNLIYGSAVAAHATLLIALLAAEAISQCSSLCGYAATAAGISLQQPAAALGGLSAAILASWFLIPRFGLWGAAGSIAIANSVLLIGFAWLLWRRTNPEEAR